MNHGKVRIIGGRYRHRQLHFPVVSSCLRPTPDRVRETLFNWLGQTLDGMVCLDLFAGSGALGFEAASRGAKRVVMVEREHNLFKAIKQNTSLLGCEQVEPICQDALEFALAPQTEKFDIIFLDPPYRQGWIGQILPNLSCSLIHRNTTIYVEAETKITTLGSWNSIKQGKAGQVFYHLMCQE